jgi:hypothetical protein
MALTRSATLLFSVIALATAFTFLGCSGGSSPSERIAAQAALSGKPTEKSYPLAGSVTIDGLPPATFLSGFPGRHQLLVMLYDSDRPKNGPKTWPVAIADPDGHFEFSFAGTGDGRPTGHYVFVFVVLDNKKKKGLLGPDKLKNLYNDPDKNETDPKFKIFHQEPGKTNYEFNLAVADKEEVSAGPKAVTKLKD